jgi:putative sigma-54 modulation protein
MAIPTEITFHEIQHSDAVELSVLRWVARLEHFYDRIVRCVVKIEQPHRSHRHGREFEVHVVLDVPGGEIATSRVRHEDIYVAIADAFRCSRRQLLDHVDARRSFVKAPGAPRPMTTAS